MSEEWFGVRCVFASAANKPWGPHDLPVGQIDYQERITLWRAASAEEAIALAEQDAAEYADTLECEYLGLAQAYRLPESPAQGEEVFSLIRRSSLAPEDYLSQFFETGTEFASDPEDG